MNNTVFGKTIENLKKHRDIELMTIEARRNYLVSKPKQILFWKIYQPQK